MPVYTKMLINYPNQDISYFTPILTSIFIQEGLIAGSWEGHDEHYRLAHIGEREIAEYEEHLRENYWK